MSRAMKFASSSPERHRHLTAMDVCPVLDFARRLAGYKRSIWLRFVLVPGLTDRDEDIAQIAKFSAGLGNMQRVDVLPFHQMGRFIWKELKYNYTLEYIQPPSLEAIEKVCSFAPRDSRPSGKAASIHGT